MQHRRDRIGLAAAVLEDQARHHEKVRHVRDPRTEATLEAVNLRRKVHGSKETLG